MILGTVVSVNDQYLWIVWKDDYPIRFGFRYLRMNALMEMNGIIKELEK